MIGSINCVYETPCGWCSKWDKKCNKKTPEHEQGQKRSHVDDSSKEADAVRICMTESDHEWECCGISIVGTDYVCKKCGTRRFYPIKVDE